MAAGSQVRCRQVGLWIHPDPTTEAGVFLILRIGNRQPFKPELWNAG